MGGILTSLVANSEMKIGNKEVKNTRLEVGSSEKAGGSQRDSVEYEENEATKKPVFRDSIQEKEQKNSQIEVRNMINMDPAVKEPSTQKIKSKENSTNRDEETDEQKPGAYERFCTKQDLRIKS